MDDILFHDIALFLSEISGMEHSADVAVVSAAIFSFASFITATALLYDLARPRVKKKIFGSPMGLSITALAMVFYSLALYGVVRLIDKIEDVAFLLNNPQAQTTLSQQSVYTEIPLFLASVAIFNFGVFYLTSYSKMETIQEKRLLSDETGDIRG